MQISLLCAYRKSFLQGSQAIIRKEHFIQAEDRALLGGDKGRPWGTLWLELGRCHHGNERSRMAHA